MPCYHIFKAQLPDQLFTLFYIITFFYKMYIQFFNALPVIIDAASAEIYTLSLHDALPISRRPASSAPSVDLPPPDGPSSRRRSPVQTWRSTPSRDRKSTRLNSSHSQISYAVFCLK